MISRENQIFDFILAIILTILIFTLPGEKVLIFIPFAFIDSCLIGKAIYRITWDELWDQWDIFLGFKKDVN